MATKTYDSSQVAVIIGGVPVTGTADGQFLSVAWDENLYDKVTGADGETMRVRKNKRTATVTLTLLQTSSMNDVLSAFVLADDANNSGSFPIMIKDMNGRTLIMAEDAWVEDRPDVNFGVENEDREWTIALGKTSAFIGGNG